MKPLEAKSIADKFSSLFQLFSQCHNVYNASRYLSDTEITKLGKLCEWTYGFAIEIPSQFFQNIFCEH